MIIIVYTFLAMFLLVIGLWVMAQNRERFGIREMGAWGWGYFFFLLIFYVIGCSWLKFA